MKIKRYIADDMRHAMTMIKEDQGPDAVILSTRKLDEGIEVVAAADADDIYETKNNERHANEARPVEGVNKQENVKRRHVRVRKKANAVHAERKTTVRPDYTGAEEEHRTGLDDIHNEMKSIRSIIESQMSGLIWKTLSDKSPVQIEVIKKLYAAGFTRKVVNNLISGISQMTDFSMAWRSVLSLISESIHLSSDDVMRFGGVCALVGPTGVGKTTTIAKIASRYSMTGSEGSVGLITVDNHRVAAHDQLRTYAQLIGVPMRVARSRDELESALNDFSTKQLVLIDTAGLGQYDARVNDIRHVLDIEGWFIRKTLVLPATVSESVVQDVITNYAEMGLNDTIITKIDESPNIGSVLSGIITAKLPVSYLCDGQQVPENISVARRSDLVGKCIAKGKSNPVSYDEEIYAMEYSQGGVNV